MKSIFSSLFACLLWINAEANAAELLVDLKVNHQKTPLALETDTPVFSWKMHAANSSSAQIAYSLELGDESGKRIWGSGKIPDAQSHSIRYGGPSLQPLSHYQWQVRVWTKNGQVISGKSWFETGFMEPNDKYFPGAKWIGGDQTDRPFFSNYLSVFEISISIILDKESNSKKAAFLFGGNDFRLKNRNLNLQGVENSIDASYVAAELDITPLAQDENAKLHIYRVGYTQSDSSGTPLYSLDIPRSMIDEKNQYETQSITIKSNFGLLSIYINGEAEQNLITPNDPNAPSYIPQGLNINPLAFNDSRTSLGNPTEYISFPMLANIGFWVRKGEKAFFRKFEIKNVRKPRNRLFVAGHVDSSSYQELFLSDSHQKAISGSKQHGYSVDGRVKSVFILKDPSRLSTPMLRTEFSLHEKTIRKARLFATARGIYELYLNGDNVGADVFAPGLTQYNIRHNYQVYDVTHMLNQSSANTLGAWLGEGWWSGNSTYTVGNWNYFGDRQSLMVKLIVTYDDGSTQEINSHPNTWTVFNDGPLRYGSFFQGEVYDATLDQAVNGWSEPGFSNKKWNQASEVFLDDVAYFDASNSNRDKNENITSYDQLNLMSQIGDPPRVVEVIAAQSVEQVSPGVFVYDLGQNIAGIPRISIPNTEQGQRVLLRFAEMKYPHLEKHHHLGGHIMMENIRAAFSHDLFIANGGPAVIEPRFTFHGFRYIEITGLNYPLPLDKVNAKVVSSINALHANFESSNQKVNRLWQNITWSMKANFLSIPTDTPARNERMGWGGDINMFSKTATYMSDVYPFLSRHTMAMRDLQGASGRFPDVAPVGGGFGGLLWGSAGITVPWQMYRQYGDSTVLREHYEAMQKYMVYLDAQIDPNTGVLIDGPLGDWLSPEGRKNDNTLLWAAYHIHLLEIMSNVSSLLGFENDHKAYRTKIKQRKVFFQKTYIDSETGATVHSGVVSGFFAAGSDRGKFDRALKGRPVDTQASYAIPLALGVIDGELRKKAEKRFAEVIMRSNPDDQGRLLPPCSLMTGFIGTASILDALTEANRDDLAYCVLQQESYPSWLYSVVNGATTIWERLDSFTKEDGFGGNNSMNSFNHYSFGSVGAWLISNSLGIQRDEYTPAFQRFILKPTPDPSEKMTWAKGYYDSVYGRIESEWRIEPLANVYFVSVPKNTTSEIRLLANSQHDIDIRTLDGTEPGKINLAAKQYENRVGFELTPGRYQFTVAK
jgi:alpha-L-rhamnosidase